MQSIPVEDLLSDTMLNQLKSFLNKRKNELGGRRTVKLWLNYLEMGEILQKFMIAERTCQWSLHLQTVTDMLPFFAATGHNLYTS